MIETITTVVVYQLNGVAGGPGSSQSSEIQLIELEQLPHRAIREDEIVSDDLLQFASIDPFTGETLLPIRLIGF